MDPDPPPAAPSPTNLPEPNHVTSEPNHVTNHVTSPDHVAPHKEHVTQPAVQHVTPREAVPVPPVAAVVERPTKESIPVINHVPQPSPPEVEM